MEKKDKKIICKDCGQEFIFTVGEQEFFEEKGFTNEPVRCKECRDKKRNQNNRPRSNGDFRRFNDDKRSN